MSGDWLSYDLAQRIVDRTREVIDYNINIRDRQGRIIASGEKHRLNTVSQRAAEGIARNEILQVNPEEATGDAGMEPGVQIPINFQGEIIGAVDITGLPEEVKDYVGLVKMTVELMLQQAYYMRRLHMEEKTEEQFIRRILQEGEMDVSDQPWLSESAAAMGYSVEASYLVWVVEVEGLWPWLLNRLGEASKIPAEQHEELVREQLQQLQSIHSQRDLSIINLEIDKFIILSEMQSDNENEFAGRTIGEKIASQLNQNLDWEYQIGVGGNYQGLPGIKRSYQQGVEALELGKIFYPREKLYSHSNLKLERLVSDLPRNQLQKLASPFPLEEKFQKCLQTYFAADLNVSETAERLSLHRNSIRYRLDRITRLTGLDTSSWQDLILLKLGMLSYIYQQHQSPDDD